MKDFTRVCKLMKVGRCTRAIDFVKKWDFQIEKRETRSEHEDNSREMLVKENTDIELLTFSDEARKSNKQLSEQGDSVLD